jgi:hypothetical protein
MKTLAQLQTFLDLFGDAVAADYQDTPFADVPPVSERNQW